MANFVNDIGEEWVFETNTDGASVILGLYNDSTDSLSDSSTLSDITTEPTGSGYSRQTSTVTTGQVSGANFGFDNDSQYSFDVTDSSSTVDHVFVVVNFQSDSVAGDASATDHLIAVGELSQSRDLSQIDTLNVNSGDLDIFGN